MGLISPFIDIHVHIQPWDEILPAVRETLTRSKANYEEVAQFLKDPSAFVQYLDRIGAARVGLINYPSPDVMGFSEKTNDFCARYRDSHPDRFIAFGGVHPRLCKDPKAEMKRLIEDLRIDALKIHPPHQKVRANGYVDGSAPALKTIYEMAQEASIPVMIHTGTSIFPGARNRFVYALDLDDVALDFPDLKIIMAHLGRPFQTEEVLFLLRRHPHFWADCSGIPPKKLLEYFPRLEEFADRILFGTDYPSPGVRSIEENVEAFWALPLQESSKRKILFENAQRLFPS